MTTGLHAPLGLHSLNEGWRAQSSDQVVEPGETLSTPHADTRGWYDIDLPATVLATLVANGALPDPYLGTNLREIPGQGPRAQNFSNHPMPPDSPFRVAWWFRKELRVPADAGPFLRLQLDGVNYRANVYVNGHWLPHAIAGAYRVFELDVTRLLRRDGVNVIALQVLPPEPTDLAITWVDWNPSPPDKNMGLWRDVWLRTSGPVALCAPYVVSKVEDGGARARLTIAGELENLSDEPQLATVSASLPEAAVAAVAAGAAEVGGQRFSLQFQLGPRERRWFELAPADDPRLVLDRPRLWWPRFMGDPALYELALSVSVGAVVSDATRFHFGVREITSELTADGHAQFKVNGQPLLIRGAGWATDLLLRREPARDLAQLEYVKALNLNTIRFEGMLERNDFLEWCDREGLLVIAGWCCSDLWEKWDLWTEETHEIAAESLRSQIRRVRRHPCLLTWWYGSDFAPPPRVERRYLQVLEEEGWPNPRQSSAANKPTAVTGPSGLKMEGPYEYVPPHYWLEDTARGGAFGFATEISPGAAVPPIESLRKLLPADHLWPIDAVWDFHAGGQEFHTVSRFAEALDARYGASQNAEQFAELSQLMTYEGQRAMFEAYTRNKYQATGVIQWMLNNAWPSLIWHLHDWYLRAGGGFHGTQKACEPLHVMYSYDDHSVVVTNQHRRDFRGLRVLARVFDVALAALHEELVTVDVAADGKARALTLPRALVMNGPSPVTFVDLRLYTAAGELVSVNFYWLPRTPDVVDYARASWLHAPTATYADLTALRTLPRTELAVRAVRANAVSCTGVRVELHNATARLAFFVQARLADETGADVLPVVWSDNYVCLLPGDTRTLRAVLPAGGGARDLRVEVRGLNLPTVTVPVASATTARPLTEDRELDLGL